MPVVLVGGELTAIAGAVCTPPPNPPQTSLEEKVAWLALTLPPASYNPPPNPPPPAPPLPTVEPTLPASPPLPPRARLPCSVVPPWSVTEPLDQMPPPAASVPA